MRVAQLALYIRNLLDGFAMSINFKTPIVCTPVFCDALESIKSPVLDVGAGGFRTGDVIRFVHAFVSFYYGIPKSKPLELLKFVEDLERHVYTHGGEMLLEYGIFMSNPDRPGSTGLSDKGLTFYLFVQDITDALGMDISFDGGIHEQLENRLVESGNVMEFADNLVAILMAHGKL